MSGINQALIGSDNSFHLILDYTSDATGVSIATIALALGWNGISPVQYSVWVHTGVTLGSVNTLIPAFTTGTLSTGSFGSLIIDGFIMGAGGNGGNAATGVGPTVGGTAISVSSPITISNFNIIGGGGGGGGGGESAYIDMTGYANYDYGSGGGGGGGRGFNGGIGGSQNFAYLSSYTGVSVAATPGANGNSTSPGGGGGVSVPGTTGRNGGPGGNGGGLGAAGGDGGFSAGFSSLYVSRTLGAPGGAAVVGNSFITWNAFGTRLGSIT